MFHGWILFMLVLFAQFSSHWRVSFPQVASPFLVWDPSQLSGEHGDLGGWRALSCKLCHSLAEPHNLSTMELSSELLGQGSSLPLMKGRPDCLQPGSPQGGVGWSTLIIIPVGLGAPSVWPLTLVTPEGPSIPADFPQPAGLALELPHFLRGLGGSPALWLPLPNQSGHKPGYLPFSFFGPLLSEGTSWPALARRKGLIGLEASAGFSAATPGALLSGVHQLREGLFLLL